MGVTLILNLCFVTEKSLLFEDVLMKITNISQEDVILGLSFV
tara:strand:- start:1893 stop:2018 length:126 start_codon:yes stop_codon:yes gene_type:complete